MSCSKYNPSVSWRWMKLPHYTLIRTPVAVLEPRSEIGSFQQTRTQNHVCNMQWIVRGKEAKGFNQPACKSNPCGYGLHSNRELSLSFRKRRDIINVRRPSCEVVVILDQCFSTFVRPRPGKFFFHKTRARSQQIHSSVPFQIFKVHTLNKLKY